MTTDQLFQSDLPIDSVPVLPIAPGQIVGERYRIEELLGMGGMGVVCRATHIELGTPVAIKVILPSLAENPELVRRFLNEARRAALLRSERIVRVHDVGQLDSGEPFLVMELLDGVELAQYLEQHAPLPVSHALSIALQIAEGLLEAHQRGIVHRDIKPANAFLVRRHEGHFAVKILDFGISKQLSDEATTLTDAGQSLGSPWYMSPEQMRDASRVDQRSDLWSLGVVLFEMLTGERPFDGATVPEVCARVLTAPTPRLSALRPEVGSELEAIVSRCLEKNPSDRFPDVVALGAALNYCLLRRGDASEVRFEPNSFLESDPAESSIAAVVGTHVSSRHRRRFANALGIFGIAATLSVAVMAFGEHSVVTVRHGAARLRAELAEAIALPPRPAQPPIPEPLPRPAPDPTWTPAPVPLPVAAPDRPVRPTPASPSSDSGAPELTSAAASAWVATQAARVEPFRPHEPPLTAEEIQARKQRYVRWLAQEGLRRIDDQTEIRSP